MKIISEISKFLVVALAITVAQPLWAMDPTIEEKAAAIGKTADRFKAGSQRSFWDCVSFSSNSEKPTPVETNDANQASQAASSSEQKTGLRGKAARMAENARAFSAATAQLANGHDANGAIKPAPKQPVLGKKGASSAVKAGFKNIVRKWKGRNEQGSGEPAAKQGNNPFNSVLRVATSEGDLDAVASQFRGGDDHNPDIPGFQLSQYILYPVLVLAVVATCYALTKGVEAYKKRNQKNKSTDQVA